MPDILYRRNGGMPARLPTICHDDANNAFTSPYAAQDLARLGFVPAPTRPADTDAQTAEWDANAEVWIMVNRPPAPEIKSPEGNASIVTMRQAKLALLSAGLIDQADAKIAALTGSEGRAAQIEWEYASELRRDHPLVIALGSDLGLNVEAIDALFAKAAQID